MKPVKTFAEYMADTERVSPAERARINFEVELIGKEIESHSHEAEKAEHRASDCRGFDG